MTRTAPEGSGTAAHVVHHAQAQRFECSVEGALAVADYRLRGNVMVMTHTGVPAALQGRGIAAALVAAALAHARQAGLKVAPACSYVAAYMDSRPETHDLRAQP